MKMMKTRVPLLVFLAVLWLTIITVGALSFAWGKRASYVKGLYDGYRLGWSECGGRCKEWKDTEMRVPETREGGA